MKLLRTFLSLTMVIGLFFISSCDKGGNDSPKTKGEEIHNALVSGGTYVASAVTVPDGTATAGQDWVDKKFQVKFEASQMTTSNYPVGAEQVWPSSPYTISEDGTTLTAGTRSYTISLNGKQLTATTTVGADVQVGRVAALGGDYTFVLDPQ